MRYLTTSVRAQPWEEVFYQVLLPHAQSLFNFDSSETEFRKGDRIVTGDIKRHSIFMTTETPQLNHNLEHPITLFLGRQQQ